MAYERPEDERPNVPPPPSGEGCTCQQRDGEPDDNDWWPSWLTRGCPVHDPRVSRLLSSGQS